MKRERRRGREVEGEVEEYSRECGLVRKGKSWFRAAIARCSTACSYLRGLVINGNSRKETHLQVFMFYHRVRNE